MPGVSVTGCWQHVAGRAFGNRGPLLFVARGGGRMFGSYWVQRSVTGSILGSKAVGNDIPSAHSMRSYSSSGNSDTIALAQSQLKQFLELYSSYKGVIEQDGLDWPFENTDLKHAKKQLKLASRELADHLDQLDLLSVLAVLSLSNSIGKRCKLLKLHGKALEFVLGELRSNEELNPKSVLADEVISGYRDIIEPGHLHELLDKQRLIALALGSLRTLDLKNPSTQILDELFSLVNSSLYQWSPEKLVLISSHVAWICRFCEHERFGSLLRRCVSVTIEGTEKSGLVMSRKDIMSLMKAYSVVRAEASSDSKFAKLINALLSREERPLPSDAGERMNVLYKRAKGNVHLLNVMLITGVCLEPGILDIILKNVMDFLLDYFAATSHVWKLQPPVVVTENYSNIDPRVSEMLYAKYPNKLIRKPGSLDREDFNSDRSREKLQERYQAVVASLGRLHKARKITFCRGTKLLDIRLRLLHREVYQSLSNETRMFLKAVSSYRFNDQVADLDEKIRRVLRHMGYRPLSMMLDGAFPLHCIDHEKKLYLALCNGKEARLGPEGEILYSKYMELKLSYLSSTGWSGTTVLQSELKGVPENAQVSLIRNKLQAL